MISNENNTPNNQYQPPDRKVELSPCEKLLDELARDMYGYDLRNWKEAGITEEEIRKRYEFCTQGNDYPIVSASRYFYCVLPELKTKFSVPVEKIVEIIVQSRDRNWSKLKESWADEVKWGLKMYLKHKQERDLEHIKRNYEDYARYCNLLNHLVLPKEHFWNLAKQEHQKEQGGKNGIL